MRHRAMDPRPRPLLVDRQGPALAAVRGEAVQPTLLTVPRAFEYDLKKANRDVTAS